MFRIPTRVDFDKWRSALRLLVIVAVTARLMAAAILVLGPWTDETSELAGWDVERFVEVAESDDRLWAETPVEYPPGSVVVFEVMSHLGRSLADAPTVGAHRILVMAMIICDLLSAVLLHRRFGAGASSIYLLLGLPLVPMGLLRLDLVTTLMAIVAVAAIGPSDRFDEPPTMGGRIVAGSAIAIGAAVKLWPALLAVPLWSVGRWRTAVTAGLLGATSAVLWLTLVRAGLAPVDQVLSLRGATGWHVESTGGLVTTLWRTITGGDIDPTLELNAYRIGTISPPLSMAGRAAVIVTLLGLGAQAATSPTKTRSDQAERVAMVMLGALGMLLATAPLFSPQFVLWLIPWAAIGHRTATVRPAGLLEATPLILTAGACVITGATLAVFGPPGLTNPVAAGLLLLRNVAVGLLPVACWLRLRSPGSPDSSTVGTEIPDQGSGPRL